MNKDKRADYSTTDDDRKLREHARDYIDLLSAEKYNQFSILQYKRCLAQFGRLMRERRPDLVHLDETTIGTLVIPIGELEGLSAAPARAPRRLSDRLCDLCRRL